MIGAPDLERCESCGEPMPFLGTLAFRRGKPRRVCALCLAHCIQDGTGWKMVRQVEQYIRSSIEAGKVSELYRGMAAAARSEAEVPGE